MRVDPVASEGPSTMVGMSAALAGRRRIGWVFAGSRGVRSAIPHLPQNREWDGFWLWQCPQITMGNGTMPDQRAEEKGEAFRGSGTGKSLAQSGPFVRQR
ncbi:MAG: hypothetical protein QOG51_260 [Verrucomicrobiota bacterium]|jgi:hypothetical protein